MGRRRERGVVLIAALWTVMLLAIIAGSLIQVARGERQIGRTVLADAQARALTEAGIVHTIASLLARDPEDAWSLDGTPRTVTIAGTQLEISVQDELGKIDLNAAPDDLLKSLFISIGAEEAAAAAIADAIADWRDADDLKRAHGAERDDYHAAGRPEGPRNGPFESVDELEQVLGVTHSMAERARPALTVYSHRPFVDPATAPRAALRALTAMDEGNVEDMLRARGPNASSSRNGVEFAPADFSGRAFSITARTKLHANADHVCAAVIRFTDHPHQPFLVHGWC